MRTSKAKEVRFWVLAFFKAQEGNIGIIEREREGKQTRGYKSQKDERMP